MRLEEWQEQKKLARLLEKWMDRTRVWWTATDPVAPNAISGAIRKARGVMPGVPDVLVWYCEASITKSIGVELKSRRGKCSRTQRLAREGLLRAGAQWRLCRSARSAMFTLYEAGVPFRTIAHEDGTIERWQQPELPAWEVPKRNPQERRPRAPDRGTEIAAADIAGVSTEGAALQSAAAGATP